MLEAGHRTGAMESTGAIGAVRDSQPPYPRLRGGTVGEATSRFPYFPRAVAVLSRVARNSLSLDQFGQTRPSARRRPSV